MKAIFIGWQETGLKEQEPFPLFNIDAPNTPRHGSTVGKDTLNQLGILIPNYPEFIEWKNDEIENQEHKWGEQRNDKDI